MNPQLLHGAQVASPPDLEGGPKKRGLRIVHVIVSLEVGGAEIALLRLASAARLDGQRHSVIALMSGGALRERFAQAGIAVVELDMRRAPLSSFVRLVRQLRVQQPDIVQTWLFAADFLGGLAARLAGCRVVLWSIHSVEVSAVSSRATRIFRALNAKLSRWVPTRIVSVATAALRTHVEIGYDASKFLVIPNGFDLDYLRPDPAAGLRQRQTLGIDPDEFVIGWVGRYNTAKDCETLLRAAGQVFRQHRRLRFVMAGRQIDPGNGELMSMAKAAGLDDCLILAGEQRDVRPFYAAMDVFCMSSLTEAFPLVLGEAMCMGLPCIATDVGDSAALLGDTGEIVPPRSPRALAEGLNRLIQMEPGERATLGSAARARVAAEFSLAASCERYQSLYLEMIKEREER